MLHFLFVSESIMRPSLVSLSPAWYWSRSAWNVYNKCYILGFVQQDGKGYCLLCWWNRFWTVPVKSLTFLWFPPTGFTRSGEIDLMCLAQIHCTCIVIYSKRDNRLPYQMLNLLSGGARLVIPYRLNFQFWMLHLVWRLSDLVCHCGLNLGLLTFPFRCFEHV